MRGIGSEDRAAQTLNDSDLVFLFSDTGWPSPSPDPVLLCSSPHRSDQIVVCEFWYLCPLFTLRIHEVRDIGGFSGLAGFEKITW